jgi:hypothetical protein
VEDSEVEGEKGEDEEVEPHPEPEGAACDHLPILSG